MGAMYRKKCTRRRGWKWLWIGWPWGWVWGIGYIETCYWVFA